LAALSACVSAAPLLAQQSGRAAGPAAAGPSASEPSASAVEKDIRRRQAALDSIKAELERGRAKFRELQNEEGNYLGRLEQIEKNISVSGQYIDLVQRQIDTTEKTIIALGDSLVKAEDDLFRARELMKRRMRGAYMAGETGRLQMLLAAKSPAEFIYRVRYFQDLNRYDRRLAESIRESIVSVNDKKTSQEDSRLNLVKLLADKREEQQALVEEETDRRRVLEDIRNKKEAFAAMVAELEGAQRELDGIIQILEGRRRKAMEDEKRRAEEERKAVISFESRKGKLGWPVEGEVASKFGRVVHPVYKTVIMNNGIDIAAKKGAPVKNVAPGSVAHVGWMRGLGRLVIVDHSGGFLTIYAHLDDIAVKQDQQVAIGAEIGKVGETGTAGGAKLHFEIRKAAETLNPEEWLAK
jgi:septal ring factor EnvC (AmiA/AmiB activator)